MTDKTAESQIKIPLPAINRLCMVYSLCEALGANGESEISSASIAKHLGVAAHNVRKDISMLGEVGASGSGYNITALKDHIAGHLGLGTRRKACMVGLGRIGSAVIEYQRLFAGGCEIVAGFDSNTNRLETIITTVPTYPSYEMENIIRRDSIEIGIIAVPALAAESCAADLAAAGIKGIINFSSGAVGGVSKKVVVRNVDIVNEFRVISALLSLNHPLE